MIYAPGSYVHAPLPDNTALGDPAAGAELVRQAGLGTPYVNTWQYTAPITVVPVTQPLVPVKLMQPNWNGVVPAGLLKLAAIFKRGLPIPAGFKPMTDTDAEAVFYQPDYVNPDYPSYRGRLWECWRLKVNTDADKATMPWTCQHGGRMNAVTWNPGHFMDWRFSGNRFNDPSHPDSTYQEKGWGTTATSIPLAGLTLTLADMDRGYCDHALGLAVTDAKDPARWPAQRDDDHAGTGPLHEGMRLRLPPGFTIPNLHPVARIIARAARDYGLVIWDQAGVLSFRAEPAVQWNYFGSTPGYSVLNGFPWGSLQALAVGSDAAPNPTT